MTKKKKSYKRYTHYRLTYICFFLFIWHTNKFDGLTATDQRANPEKTQINAYPLKNSDANRQLNVSWNGTTLIHNPKPVYLGVALDNTLIYKHHVIKRMAQVEARSIILRKLSNSIWGKYSGTIRRTNLALYYSAAEYACPVWGRCTPANKLGPFLKMACVVSTGCLKHLLQCPLLPEPCRTDNLAV